MHTHAFVGCSIDRPSTGEGLKRKQVSPDTEKAQNSLKQIRSAGNQFKREIAESIQPVVDLLSDILDWLELKRKKFQVEGACSKSDVEHFWEILHLVEPSLTSQDTSCDKVKDMQDLQVFFNHFCQMRHYTFCIKKCGDISCIICKPVKMDKEKSKNLLFFPDPLIQDDGHYVPFEKVFTETTIEK